MKPLKIDFLEASLADYFLAVVLIGCAFGFGVWYGGIMFEVGWLLFHAYF